MPPKEFALVELCDVVESVTNLGRKLDGVGSNDAK